MSARFTHSIFFKALLLSMIGCNGRIEQKAPAPESALRSDDTRTTTKRARTEPLIASKERGDKEIFDPIPPFIEYLHQHGIALEKDQVLSNWWKVRGQPPDREFDVVVALKGFKANDTASGMQEELNMTSLALLLNAPARLAMSFPSLRGRHPGIDGEAWPKAKSLTIYKELLTLFEGYAGSSSR